MEPAQAKATMMDCEACNELLADFLLDELPESEAVLVHEHLLICTACMKAYRELKGTGKALEAVTAMQPVKPSENFRAKVRAEAHDESEKIVAKLPPERRLRLEARREARQSIRMLAQKKTPTKVWSPGFLFLALAGAAVLAAILLWPRSPAKPTTLDAVGVMTVVMGKTDQFYLKENQPHTPVSEGKGVLPGDVYTTGDTGRARIDMKEGGSIFMGPSCDAAFRFNPSEGNDLVIRTDNGEIGVLRPENATGSSAQKFGNWEIRSDAGVLQFAPGTHAYARMLKVGKSAELDVSVLAGCVHALSKDGSKNEALYAGQRAALTAGASIVVESLTDERPPSWRIDLVNDADLAQLFGAASRVVSRKPGQLQVELDYKFQIRGRDWHPEPEQEDPALLAKSLLSDQNGVLKLPSGFLLRHAGRFAPPLSFELKLNAESRRDASFAFGALETPAAVVAVDVTREATLSVQEKGKLRRRDAVPARGQTGTPEVLLLEIKSEGTGFAAVLHSSAGTTKSVPLWKERADAPGGIWLQALGGGILADEIKITGILSAEWLREKLAGAQ